MNHSMSEPSLSSNGYDESRRSRRSKSNAAVRSNLKLDARTSKFVERQLAHPSIETRKSLAQLHRRVVQDGKSADDIEFWGRQGVEGFQTYLRKKFGSIVAGWRSMNVDGSGRLSFYEFCNQCRRMGYHGNLKELWKLLDKNQNGSISLTEVDPEVGYYVGTFKVALMHKYGSLLAAWKQGIDKNNNGRIEETEIENVVKLLGLSLDPHKLYRFLCPESSSGLTLGEFDPDSWHRYISGDVKGFAHKPNREFLDDLPADMSMPREIKEGPVKDGARKFRQQLVENDRADLQVAREEHAKFRLGLHTVDGFKAALVNRCGSLLTAWREALDLDGNQRLTFGEFTQALHRLGFHGNVLGLFKQLDTRGTGVIVFSDLDPDTDADLKEVKSKLIAKYSNLLIAWVEALDTAGTGIVNEDQFVQACQEVGFAPEGSDPIKRSKRLFKTIQPDVNRKFVTLHDFDTKAFNALNRGDFRMLTERESNPKRPLEMTFDERQREGFFFKIRRAWEAGRREEYAKACRMAERLDPGPETEEFHHLCVRQFGTIIGAWRGCLDSDKNGKLSFNEFCKACRRLGYSGDLKSLWNQFDAQKKGFISLRDLDPEADELVGSFLKMLADKYGTLDNAWKHGFNKDPHDSIDRQTLEDACKALQYPHNARELFLCLQPVPGRQLLTIWDIDPLCTRKKQRGDPAYLADAKPENFTNTSGLDITDNSQADGAANTKGSDMNTATSTRSKASTQSTLNMPGLSEKQHMHKVLKQRYGSTLAAWRVAFDNKMTGNVSFGKFLLVLQDCCYHGNIKALWEDLCGPEEKPMIQFRDVDADAQDLIEQVREQLINQYGNLLASWSKGVDAEGIGRVDEGDFLVSCKNMGLNLKNPKKLFKMLLSHPGQRSLGMTDLEALLVGLRGSDRAAAWAGSKEDMERAQSSTNGRLPSSPPVPVSPRAHAQKVSMEHHEQDLVIRTVDDFKKMLITKYGSLFSGWRRGLDVDGNGNMTQRDFAFACQHFGIKAVQKMWSDLDVNTTGQITLMDLDPETGEAFATFERLVIDKYGSAKNGWKKGFDVDGTLRCDQDKFVNQCTAIGYTGNAERLFKLLRPEPGRAYLAYSDIWLHLNPNNFEHVDEAKIPTSPTGSSHRKPLNTNAHAVGNE